MNFNIGLGFKSHTLTKVEDPTTERIWNALIIWFSHRNQCFLKILDQPNCQSRIHQAIKITCMHPRLADTNIARRRLWWWLFSNKIQWFITFTTIYGSQIWSSVGLCLHSFDQILDNCSTHLMSYEPIITLPPLIILSNHY